MFLAQAAAVDPVVGVILGFLSLFVAIVWIVFPFLVNSKFNELIGEVRNLRTELKMRRDEDKAARQAALEARLERGGERMEKKEPDVYRL